jgi:hypothetical protein
MHLCAFQTQIRPFIFNNFQHTNLQVLSFDIDAHYPGGWGGMSRLVRFSTTAKRIPAHPLCKSPLYFQQLTNCFFAKSFSLMRIQTAPGGGGVSVGLAKRALFVGVNTQSPRFGCSTFVRSKLPPILYLESYCRSTPSRIHCCFDQEVPF